MRNKLKYNLNENKHFSLGKLHLKMSFAICRPFSSSYNVLIYIVVHVTWSSDWDHYDDVIMTMLASQITSLTVVYSIVYSDVNQRKHQSSASLAFVREIHRGPVNFPHKWPVTRKMFPFDDVIMWIVLLTYYCMNIVLPMYLYAAPVWLWWYDVLWWDLVKSRSREIDSLDNRFHLKFY